MKPSLLHPACWPSWLAIGLLRLLALLPQRWLITLGKLLGLLLYYLLPGRRHVVEVNASLCFPEQDAQQRKAFVRAVLVSSITGYLETAWSWWASDKTLAGKADYEGLELLQQADDGRGILLIGSHFTTLDLAGRLLRLKVDVDSSYQKQSNPVFDYCILKYRLKRFANMVEKTEMRRLVKLLKSGRIVWFASDQDFGRKHSVFVPFFGQPAATLTSISKILKLSGARPLYFSHYRATGANGETRYRLRISDPFAGLGDDDEANGRLINQVIEQAIREAPEQYMWVHRRFKTRPNPDDPKLYQFSHKRKKSR